MDRTIIRHAKRGGRGKDKSEKKLISIWKKRCGAAQHLEEKEHDWRGDDEKETEQKERSGEMQKDLQVEARETLIFCWVEEMGIDMFAHELRNMLSPLLFFGKHTIGGAQYAWASLLEVW